MDTEEANRLFAQATLRTLSLEIDRDVEVLRAQRFREIISILAGDDAEVAPPVGALASTGNLRTALQSVCLFLVVVKIVIPLSG
jgi:hypothetical protein